MAVHKSVKEQILSGFRRHANDTGSSEVQVALLTEKINHLSGHFLTHKKDNHSQLGLIKAVNRRRKLLDYLKKTDAKKYEQILVDLEIRK
ncbi:MAG: 30S ribosomal protein S15 [Deltaproteobacteria bacterium]|jgi:small subunit ribosomal protein S15|nr:30S ribosomal protein S15 [Deltaproteobacteria bacterium]